jgi:hypothetical protein
MTNDDNGFLPIPGLGHQDVAVVQSLLDAAGFRYHVHDGFGECADVVLIRAADLAAVKKLLSDYTIRGPRDEMIPIQW